MSKLANMWQAWGEFPLSMESPLWCGCGAWWLGDPPCGCDCGVDRRGPKVRSRVGCHVRFGVGAYVHGVAVLILPTLV